MERAVSHTFYAPRKQQRHGINLNLPFANHEEGMDEDESSSVEEREPFERAKYDVGFPTGGGIIDLDDETAGMLFERWFDGSQQSARSNVVDQDWWKGRMQHHDTFGGSYESLNKDRALLMDSPVADSVRGNISLTLKDYATYVYVYPTAYVSFVEEVPGVLLFAISMTVSDDNSTLIVSNMTIFYQALEYGALHPDTYDRSPMMTQEVFELSIEYAREMAGTVKNADGEDEEKHKYVAIEASKSRGTRKLLEALGYALKNIDNNDAVQGGGEPDYFDIQPVWYRLCLRCSKQALWMWGGDYEHLDVAFCSAVCSEAHYYETVTMKISIQ